MRIRDKRILSNSPKGATEGGTLHPSVTPTGFLFPHMLIRGYALTSSTPCLRSHHPSGVHGTHGCVRLQGLPFRFTSRFAPAIFNYALTSSTPCLRSHHPSGVHGTHGCVRLQGLPFRFAPAIFNSLIAPPLPKIRHPSGALRNPTRVQAPNQKEN